jgi:RHS repeat-associated protein
MISRACGVRPVKALSPKNFKKNQPHAAIESAQSAIEFIVGALHQASSANGAANGRVANESFQLDAVANRSGHLINSQNAGPYSYDANHRLIKVGSGDCATVNPGPGTTCYGWDAAGNLIQKTQGTSGAAQITRYAYDSQNRLTQISDTQNNAIARYSYDPFNRRLSKEHYRDAQGNLLASPKRTYYFYSDEGLIAESEQAIQVAPDASISAAQMPELTTQYIPQPGGLFTTGYLAIKTKSLAGSQAGQTIYAYYHHDHLSTPIRATDKAGNIVWSANYNAFGRAQINTAQSSIVSNLRLPGQYHDEESGLHQNWNRYYDYSVGRYITEDPIGLLGGNNRYIYAGANPVLAIDSDGRIVFVPIIVAAGAAIGGLAGAVSALNTPGASSSSVLIGALAGAAGGATAGVAGISLPVSVLVAAGANAWGQVANNAANGASISLTQVAVQGALGGAGTIYGNAGWTLGAALGALRGTGYTAQQAVQAARGTAGLLPPIFGNWPISTDYGGFLPPPCD